MVLYHVITVYQLLCAILHKLRYHSERRGVLLIPEAFKSYCVDLPLLKSLGIFHEISYMDWSVWVYSEEYLRENGWKIYRSAVNHEPDEFQEIVVGGTQYIFAPFLAMNRVEFSYLEEGCGRYAQMEEFVENIQAFHPQMAELGLYFGTLDASSPYITNIYGKIPDGWNGDERVHSFDVGKELESYPAEVIDDLRKVFGISPGEIPEVQDAILLLTEHFANMETISLRSQIRLYALLVDLFAHGRPLIVKPHPSDDVDYCEIFPDAHVLNANFPVEFLWHSASRQNWRMLAVSCTSIYSLSEKDIIQFREGLLPDYSVLCRLLVLHHLVRYLSAEESIHIYMNEPFVRWMSYFGSEADLITEVAEEPGWKVVVFEEGYTDSDLLRRCLDESKCILVSRDPLEEILEETVVKKISYTSGERKEVIRLCFFSASKDMRRKIAEFHLKIPLRYSKGGISVEQLTEQEVERLIYEGKMEMLERRVEKAEKENEELKQSLRFYRTSEVK